MTLRNEVMDALAAGKTTYGMVYNPQEDYYQQAVIAAKRENEKERQRIAQAAAQRNNPPTGAGGVTPGPVGGQQPAGGIIPPGGVPMAPNPNQAVQVAPPPPPGGVLPPGWYQAPPLGLPPGYPGRTGGRAARGGRMRRYQDGGSVQSFQAGGGAGDDEAEADLILRSILSRENETQRRLNPDDAALSTGNAQGDRSNLDPYLVNQQLKRREPGSNTDAAYDWEVSAQPVRQRMRQEEQQGIDRRNRENQALITNSPGDTMARPPRDETSSVAGRAVNRVLKPLNPDVETDYIGTFKAKLEQERRDLMYNMFGQMTDEQYAERNQKIAAIDKELARLEQARGGPATREYAQRKPSPPTIGGSYSEPIDPDMLSPGRALKPRAPGGFAFPPQFNEAGPSGPDIPMPGQRPGVGILPGEVPPGDYATPPPPPAVQPTNPTKTGTNGPITSGQSGPTGRTTAAAPPIQSVPGADPDPNRVKAFRPDLEQGVGAVDASGRDIRALNVAPPQAMQSNGREPVLNRPASGMTGGQADQGLSSNNASADLLPRVLDGVRQVARSISPGGPPPIGHGAVSPQAFAELVRRNSGQGRYSPGAAALRGMLSYYNSYLEQGNIDMANKMAYGIVQAANLYVAQEGNTALALLKSGDVRLAAAHVVRGADMAPDGMNHTLSSDGRFVVTSDQSGRVTAQTPVDGRWILAAATGMADGSLLWRSLNAAAAQMPSKGNPEGRALSNTFKMWQIELIKERIKKLRADPKNAGVDPRMLEIMAYNDLGLAKPQEGGGSAALRSDEGTATDNMLLSTNIDSMDENAER